MTVFVDNAFIPYRRMKMSHMMADTLDELHEMADAIGLKREWFQDGRYPHYDVSMTARAAAIQKGAHQCSSKFLIRRFKPANTPPEGA